MSAAPAFAPSELEVDEPAGTEPFGRIVALRGERVLAAVDLDATGGFSFAPGALVQIGTGSIGEITGFETPAPEADPELDEVVLIEIALRGRLDADGYPLMVADRPFLGAEVFAFDKAATFATWQQAMTTPIAFGTDANGDPAFLEADRLLGTCLTIAGDDRMQCRGSLAVILRGLLMKGFPARMVLLDTDGVFGPCFGRAAKVVDASRGLIPPGLLTADELATCLSISGEPLGGEERATLVRLLDMARPRSFSMEALLDAADRVRSEGVAGIGAAASRISQRLREASKDPRLGVIFGEEVDQFSAEDVLQTVFRLPDGRPPMALIQLDHLETPVRRLVAAIVMRLARTVAETAEGAVPILVAADGADVLALGAKSQDHLGVIRIQSSVPRTAQGPTLIHRSRAHPDAAVLGLDEVLFGDPTLPWAERLTMDKLPSKARPRRRALRDEAALDRESILDAIAAAWRGAPLR